MIYLYVCNFFFFSFLTPTSADFQLVLIACVFDVENDQ